MRWGCCLLLICAALVGQRSDEPTLYFTGPVPSGAENALTLEQAFVAMLDGAQTRVDLAMLRLDLPSVLAALVRAHERGVRIRVVTDGDLKRYRYLDAFALLERAGIPVRVDRGDPFNVNMHHKFLLVDEDELWTGDWNASVADTHDAAHSAVSLKSKLLCDRYRQVMDALWAGRPAGIGLKSVGSSEEWIDLAGGIRARAHIGFSRDLSVVVERAILSAQSSVRVAHLLLKDVRVVLALLEVARRGLDVKILAHDYPRRPRLREACAIFGIPTRTSTGLKALMIDDRRLLVGSWNCTRDIDHENILELEGAVALCKQWKTFFEHCWARASNDFFLDADDPKRHPVDQWRQDVHVGNPVEAWNDWMSEPSQDVPLEELWSAPELPVHPTTARLRAKTRSGTERTFGISFVGSSPRGAVCRFVVSSGRLEHSDGNHITPTMRPLVFGPNEKQELSRCYPFRVEYPEEGVWRTDLDAFIQTRSGWRWVGRWSVPPAVFQRTPWLSMDPSIQDEMTQTWGPGDEGPNVIRCLVEDGAWVPEGPGAALHLPVPAGLNPGKRPGILTFEAQAKGDPMVILGFGPLDRDARPQSLTFLPLIPDGTWHRYRVELDSLEDWNLLDHIGSLRLRLGHDGRAMGIRRVSLGNRKPLPDAALGVFRDEHGAPRHLLTVNGRWPSKAGRVWCEPGRSLELKLHSPEGDEHPMEGFVIVHLGDYDGRVPMDLEHFGTSGALLFGPPFLGGAADVAVLADGTGLAPKPIYRIGPAPTSFLVKLPGLESGATIMMQPVFPGQGGGVGPAVWLRVK